MRMYPWLVFALAFGLLLADYMSRQVLGAVFPAIQAIRYFSTGLSSCPPHLPYRKDPGRPAPAAG